MIVAGEASGDKHAARLVESLKKREDVRVIGIGGDEMKAAGVELIHHVSEMSVMGFSDIILKIPFFRRVRQDLVASLEKEKPSAVILVDYPGFNLRFAEVAKKKGIRVIYFISPQIWAWGMKRIKKIRRAVDLMLTIFKFEEEMYRREGIDAHFVGHPLLDELEVFRTSDIERFRKASSLQPDARLLALFPGSRMQEVVRLLPTMLETAEYLRDELSSRGIPLGVAVACAPGIDKRVYGEIAGRSGLNVIFTSEADLLMSAAQGGLIKSGTSTLEAVLHDLPIVVAYKTSWLNYLLGRLLIKLDSISLVNIVAGRKIVEEFVQDDFTPKRAGAKLIEIFTRAEFVEDLMRKYADLKEKLGDKGASDRAAELVLKAM